jgi:hypothetical protein
MSESSLDRDPFEGVAESFLARYRAGERPCIAVYAPTEVVVWPGRGSTSRPGLLSRTGTKSGPELSRVAHHHRALVGW